MERPLFRKKSRLFRLVQFVRCWQLNSKRTVSKFRAHPSPSQGSKSGTVVRALVSHQCGPGSTPGVDVICGLSLLLVLSLAPRGFSPGTPVFSFPQKPTFPNSNSTRNQVDEEPLCGCATCKSLFIYLFDIFTCENNMLSLCENITVARASK